MFGRGKKETSEEKNEPKWQKPKFSTMTTDQQKYASETIKNCLQFLEQDTMFKHYYIIAVDKFPTDYEKKVSDVHVEMGVFSNVDMHIGRTLLINHIMALCSQDFKFLESLIEGLEYIERGMK